MFLVLDELLQKVSVVVQGGKGEIGVQGEILLDFSINAGEESV